MSFRDRLLASLRALDPVLAVEGVLVLGSEVPNLLQHRAASTLVVSQDEIRSRAAVRDWEYRQRHHAKRDLEPPAQSPRRSEGVLVDSRGRGCEAAPRGLGPQPVGHELEPAKEIFVLPAERIGLIANRRPIRVALSAELLAARHLALLAFP